jgi:hypothetical protein
VFRLILALLWLASPAHAGPVVAGISGIVGAISTFAASSALAGFAVNLVGSVLLSAAAAALRGKQSYEVSKQGLRVPTTLPPYRFWYGESLCVPSHLQCGVDGTFIYGCVLLNSRPSQEVTTIYLDQRDLVLSGDLYDVTEGAIATNGRFDDQTVKFWVGLGDQTEPPPQLVSEMPALFAETDIWSGCTVLWYKIQLGPPQRAAKQWPNRPPEISVLGKWSKVWDMRDVAQDPDDESTWEWSDNQALCLLDFYRSNPIKSFPVDALHMASFEAAADLADEAVTLLAGGTEPRYCAGGVIEFAGAEIEDLAQPLHDAGASRPTWIGGQMGVVPGGPIDSSLTLTDVLDVDGMEYTRYAPASEMITTVRATYTAADRGYVASELEPYEIPGAQTADGGLAKIGELKLGLVQSATQAMRLQKIAGQMGRMQRQISGTLPSAAFNLVAGSVVTVGFPAPFAGRNGIYQVQSIHPTVSLLGDDGAVALRCPATLREYSEDIYAWTASEEQTVEVPVFDPDPAEVEPPGAISTVTGASVALLVGLTSVPRIRFAFDPSTTGAVISYEWQYRIDGDDWGAGGSIDSDVRDGSDQVFGFVAVAAGEDYEIRARAWTATAASDWEVSSLVTASLGVTMYSADFDAGAYSVSGVTAGLADVLSLTRASTATYIDATGAVVSASADVARIDHLLGSGALLVEPAGTNIALHSADISNGAYTRTNILAFGSGSVVNNATAPDGTTTMDLIVESTATSSHLVQQAVTITAGNPVAASVFVKRGAGTRDVRLQVIGASAVMRFDVDLDTGVISAVASGSGATITEQPWAYQVAASCWWIGMAGTLAGGDTTANVQAYILTSAGGSTSYTGDGTSGLNLWGFDVKEDAACTSHVPTGAAAVTRAADVPAMIGITANLDLTATYGDATADALGVSAVLPGYWPTLTETRIAALDGVI